MAAALNLSGGDFLYNLEAWLEAQNYLGEPPRLGVPGSEERIWADHGAVWRDPEESGRSGYWLQLHIEYQEIYHAEQESEE